MRTVWVTSMLRYELRQLLETELDFQLDIDVPNLPPGEYGDAIKGSFDLQTARMEWHRVPLGFFASDVPGAREAFTFDLVLDIGDTPRAMTDRTVHLPRAAIDAATEWYSRGEQLHTEEEEAKWEAEREALLSPLRAAFDALSVLSDALPDHGVGVELLPFGEVLRCRGCHNVLTKPVVRIDGSRLAMPRPGGAMLAAHHYGVVDATTPEAGRYYGLTEGALVTSTIALVNTVNIREKNIQDCCGFRADEGPNQTCAKCQIPIAAYWCAHSSGDFVVLSPALVDIVPASALSADERAKLYALGGYGASD